MESHELFKMEDWQPMIYGWKIPRAIQSFYLEEFKEEEENVTLWNTFTRRMNEHLIQMELQKLQEMGTYDITTYPDEHI